LMIFRSFNRRRLDHLLTELESQQLVVKNQNNVELTERGLQIAKQLTAGHRLWEAFVSKLPGDSSFWHSEADHVEHYLSPEQQEELSAQLKNVEYDPHGKIIPRDANDK